MLVYSVPSPFFALLFIFQKTSADNCIPTVFFTNVIQGFVELLEFGVF